MLGKEEMHKNTFKPLCMLAAITLAFGISTSSAHAADTDLSITQKIDKITGKESQQKYTINYTGENKNTALKIEYDRGFYAKELKVGDWDNYTGKIKVTAYTKDTKSPVMTTEADENATVSLENYSNIDWIEMNPAGDDGTQEDMTETQNIKDVDLSGTIYAGKSGKTVQVKGSVWLDDTYSGNAVCEKVITTTANDYTVASPYVQVNPDQVNYLGSTAMTIKNLQGSLKAGQLNSYHVTFNIPARMFVDSITLPKFDNASYKLYVNGNQMDTRNSKIYVNDKAANISMDITPNGDFFSQSQDMVIDMRNTVNQSGDNKVSVSVLAVCGNGCEFKADSNAMPIKYQEQTVTPSEPDTPETPSEPEQPDTPETPTLPDTTGTDTKKNNHQTTVKKNNTVTSLDLIKEDSDDTDTKKETVVDLSGVNLQSAKATKNSINTFSNPNATKKSTSLAGLNSERIQTTDIQDFENSDDTTDNQNIKDQVASTDDGIMDESPGGHESAAQKAKETVSDNRGVQLGLIIGGIVLAGIVIVIIVSKRMGKEEISTVTKEEEKPDTVEDQESGSLDQSEELNKDDTKEPKGKSLIPTERGIHLISIFPIEDLKAPVMTAQWEKRLDDIEKGTDDYTSFITDLENSVRKWTKMIMELKSDDAEFQSNSSNYKCPICGRALLNFPWGYGCSGYQDDKCKFNIPRKIASKTLTEKQIQNLIQKGDSGYISGFVKNGGKTFGARIVIDKEEKKLKFADDVHGELLCPLCGKPLRKMAWGYGCSGYRETRCNFAIGTVAKKKLTDHQIKALLAGESVMVKGMKGKNGSFDAEVRLCNAGENKGKLQFIQN